MRYYSLIRGEETENKVSLKKIKNNELIKNSYKIVILTSALNIKLNNGFIFYDYY